LNYFLYPYYAIKKLLQLSYPSLAAVLIKFNTRQIDIKLFNHKTGYTNIIQRNDWLAPECLVTVFKLPYF